ncbi:MAG: zf-HC2 domain-containing protein [Bacteroidales bacterium]|nr:zf-HC2 domain-containing protein [Bacteroidales bacterium]MBN2764522.1 zf-HC2 domain-containing protein [Bacteroidales bacterium]
MNCQECLKYLDEYHEDSLPGGIKDQVKEHLETCTGCAESYHLMILAGRVIKEEKNVLSNPFLSTRIMAQIGSDEMLKEPAKQVPVYVHMLQSVLVTLSLALAVISGIFAGNIYKPDQAESPLPIEMAYIDDATLEAVTFFTNE